jgi:hypothetical protein
LQDVCEFTCFPPESFGPLRTSLNVSSCPRGYAPRLETNNWDSHKVSSGLARILVEEILNYKVEPLALGQGVEVFLRVAKGWSVRFAASRSFSRFAHPLPTRAGP